MEQQNIGASKVLQYAISSKPPFAVVSFRGALSRSAVDTIEKCEGELLAMPARFVVFSFHEACALERPLIAPLTKLQKHLRDKGKELRVCNLELELLKQLVDAGAVRKSELHETLQQALVSFKPNGSAAAA